MGGNTYFLEISEFAGLRLADWGAFSPDTAFHLNGFFNFDMTLLINLQRNMKLAKHVQLYSISREKEYQILKESRLLDLKFNYSITKLDLALAWDVSVEAVIPLFRGFKFQPHLQDVDIYSYDYSDARNNMQSSERAIAQLLDIKATLFISHSYLNPALLRMFSRSETPLGSSKQLARDHAAYRILCTNFKECFPYNLYDSTDLSLWVRTVEKFRLR